MQTPLVVDALRDQLLQVLEWHHHPRPAFCWGVALHRRNERGRLRFGVVTPAGESLLLSAPLLEELQAFPCWLDGVVPVRLEARKLSGSDPVELDPVARGNRPRLVEELAVYFKPATSPGEAQAFKQMAGVLTPATMPSELFVLTRQRPPSWPL